jgi:hypothetical protein
MMKLIVVFSLLFTALNLSAQADGKSVLLLNGYLHVGNGEVLESALVGVRNGRIALVKNSLAYTYKTEEWDTIIDLQGQHIYPGFVAPNSTLGLTEIDAVRATRDYNEVGIYNPHVRSQIAFNVESKVISTVRTNGVLLTQATPRGGSISGTSSVMAMDGWNWEDATVLKDDGIHVNWPSSTHGNWGEGVKRNEQYDAQKREMLAFFDMAEAYTKLPADQQTDGRLDAMKGCFDGKKRVYFHANDIQQLLDIISFSNTYDFKHPVIIGGNEAYRCWVFRDDYPFTFLARARRRRRGSTLQVAVFIASGGCSFLLTERRRHGSNECAEHTFFGRHGQGLWTHRRTSCCSRFVECLQNLRHRQRLWQCGRRKICDTICVNRFRLGHAQQQPYSCDD